MNAVTQTRGHTALVQPLHTKSPLLRNAPAIIESYHTEGAGLDTHHTSTARLDVEQAPDHQRPAF